MTAVDLTRDEMCALVAAATNERDFLADVREYTRSEYPGKDLTSGIRKLSAAIREEA